MALVVVLPTIIAQETHGIVLRDMLGVVLHELLHAIPERRDGVNILVQTQDKAVFLIVVLHVTERIKADIAEQFDAGFHTPVEFVVHHQGVAEEEARLITAHVSIALRVTVDNIPLSHVLPSFRCLFLINPFRIGPVLGRDNTVGRCT